MYSQKLINQSSIHCIMNKPEDPVCLPESTKEFLPNEDHEQHSLQSYHSKLLLNKDMIGGGGGEGVSRGGVKKVFHLPKASCDSSNLLSSEESIT